MSEQSNRRLASGSEELPGTAQPMDHGNCAWPLYSAAFLMALSLSMVSTAMPFILVAMGGTKAHVGYAPAVNTLAYMIALFVTGSLLGHLKVKRVTISAGAATLLAFAGMTLAVLGAMSQLRIGRLTWIWTFIFSGGIGGAALAFYWPFLMSWVSAEYEGVQLNRRFGRYNGAWSSGAMIGPAIGAWLVETSAALPVAAAVAFVSLALLALSLSRDGSSRVAVLPQAAGTKDIPCSSQALAAYRWTSRIALFNACLCFAMIRSQFALVLTGLGFSESQFGIYQTICALCMFSVLVAAGRWAVWHFRPALLTVAHLLLLTTLLMIICGRTLPVFFASSILLGVAYGFAYSSHLYYGASTSKKRSVRMAIHEIVIASGLTLGAAAGGYLCEHIGTYTPYWFAVSVVGLGLLGQMAIHAASQTKPRASGQAPLRPVSDPPSNAGIS